MGGRAALTCAGDMKSFAWCCRLEEPKPGSGAVRLVDEHCGPRPGGEL